MFKRMISMLLVAVILIATLSGCLNPIISSPGYGRNYNRNYNSRYGRSTRHITGYRIDPLGTALGIMGGAALLAVLNMGRSETAPAGGYSISPECEQYLYPDRYPGYDVERLVYSCERALADRRIDEIRRRASDQRRMESEVYNSTRGR